MIKWLMNLKLSMKILIAPTAVIAFLLISGAVSFTSLTGQKSAIEDIFGTRFKSFQASARIVKDVTTVHANLYKVISWATANYDAKKIDQLAKEQLKTLDEAVAALDKILKTAGLKKEETETYRIVMAALTDYQKSAFAALDLASSDANMATMFMETADGKFQSLYKNLNDLLELETRLAQVTYDSSIAGFNASLKVFVLVILIAIVVSILLSLAIARGITRPVHRAIEVIRKIADGDLTQEIALSSNDEIGTLAHSVDQMRLKMGEAVGGSVETSQNLSEGAAEQAASLEETSSSLEELASMTKSNAQSTGKANALMTGTKQTIEKASASMNRLTVSMKEIATASEQTQKIVKTIDEISFQTNLLALNAAVEAARAGEAGAGFAVVADEVRNLAMRAAEAARSTADSMTDIVAKVKNGEQLVVATNADFGQMQASSAEIVDLMGGIAEASREQSEGIEQINRAVLELNRVTQQNAASAEELASIMSVFVTESGDRKRSRAETSFQKRLPAP